MFDALGRMLGAWGSEGSDYWLKGARNAMLAYDAAWAKRDGPEPSVDVLIDELILRDVPGADMRPQSRADLALWFDAWRDGTPPDTVREVLRERRDAQRRT